MQRLMRLYQEHRRNVTDDGMLVSITTDSTILFSLSYA